MTNSLAQSAATKILQEIKAGKDIGKLMDSMAAVWRGDRDVILKTVEEVGQAIGKVERSSEFRNSIENLWFSILYHHGKGGGMEGAMLLLLDNSNLGKDTLASLAKADGTSWALRDKFMTQTYPLVMGWMEKNHSPAFIRTTLDYITDQIVGLACREEGFAEQALSRLFKYYSPSDIVRMDTARGRGTWAQCWANHCFDGIRKRPCGARALDLLVAWGVDVDQPGIHGTNALEDHIEGYGGAYEYAVEHLIAAGAKWRGLFERGTEEQKNEMMKASGVRRELLLDVAHGGAENIAPKPAGLGVGRYKSKM